MAQENRVAVRHVMLKHLGTKLLKAMGFAETEIYEEYQVRVRDLKSFVVDVVGIKPGKTVAIECGDCEPKRLMALEGLFDEVVWLPYIGNRNFIRDEAAKAYLSQLEAEAARLQTRVALLENELYWARCRLEEVLNRLKGV